MIETHKDSVTSAQVADLPLELLDPVVPAIVLGLRARRRTHRRSALLAAPQPLVAASIVLQVNGLVTHHRVRLRRGQEQRDAQGLDPRHVRSVAAAGVMTATTPEIVGIEHLDFDPVLPCDSTKAPDGCPEAATYRYTATCPNGHPTTFFYCTPHAEDVARYLPQVYSMYCDCGWHAIVRLGDIATLEPL